MTRILIAVLALGLLSACVELPGADSDPASRYMLQSANEGTCKAPDKSLHLRIIKTSAGLDTQRVARRNKASGEFTYLKGVRWVESADAMLEQRLAADLECSGYSVTTSHSRQLGQDRLACEVRAFNLVQAAASNEAEISLSCIYSQTATKRELPLRVTATAAVTRWTSDQAVAALSQAYTEAFDDLISQLHSNNQVAGKPAMGQH